MKIERLLFALLLFLFGALLLFCLNSCAPFANISKHKKNEKLDSSIVHKSDSSHVTNNYYQSHSDSSWWREIINLIPKGKDTTINNTTVPVNNYYPAQIIREGGTLTRTDIARMLDSMNRTKSDSTHIVLQTDTKDKETKVPTTLLIFVGFGILILFGVAGIVILAKTHTSIKSLKT